MPKFTVHKKLELVFETEAANAREAEEKCINASDMTEMWVGECDYVVYDADGNHVIPGDDEGEDEEE